MAAPSVRLVVLLLVVGNLCITVPLAYLLNLSGDEAYTLHTTGSGVGHALRQAIRFELQPPAYFVLVSVWRGINPQIFFCRLFSVLCVALTIPVTARASGRYLPHIHPFWAAAGLAFNPGAVWAAVEARPYAMSLLVATTLLWLFPVAFLSDEPRRPFRVAYAGLACLALYTQYYLGFLLAAAGAALLVLGRWRALRDYLLWMLPVTLGFVPLMLVVPGQVSEHTVGGQPVPLGVALRGMLARFEDTVLSIVGLPGGRAVRWLYRGALAALVLVAQREGLARRQKAEPSIVALLTTVLFLAMAFVALQLAFGSQVTSPRHTLLFLPAGLLLLYGAVGAARSPWPAAVATALILCTAGSSLYARYEPLAKYGDHARVAEYLRHSASPGQPIFVFPGEQALALEQYYRGHDEIIPLPGPASLTRYDPREFAWVSREHVLRTFREEMGPSRECWLVTYGVDQAFGHPIGSELLESVVDADFLVVRHERFYAGTLVRLLRRVEGGQEGRRAADPRS